MDRVRKTREQLPRQSAAAGRETDARKLPPLPKPRGNDPAKWKGAAAGRRSGDLVRASTAAEIAANSGWPGTRRPAGVPQDPAHEERDRLAAGGRPSSFRAPYASHACPLSPPSENVAENRAIYNFELLPNSSSCRRSSAESRDFPMQLRLELPTIHATIAPQDVYAASQNVSPRALGRGYQMR
ncbi:hypothetical protein C8J35_101139 [Rhizobium sp. PP-F2F-G38]|nr:hypothetical protein C8J37_101139 [Rhizobium sp. PP-WC-1G-195]PYF00334.1 hypothetical protein C8J35_101139 [Rhizobium sp. PP-F2F-G38]